MVQRSKRNQKEARVHFIPNLKVRVFVTLCAPLVITSELILYFAILMLVPLVMAYLSLILKDSMNRWVNIIISAVFFVIWFIGVVSAVSSAYWGGALMTLSAVIASALIFREAWKSKQKA
ncbi:MAG TPA: DUF6326 family protein [Methanosarcina sp.]|nr:DUF6326 family protein [Methanosarcina sp.]